MSFRELNLSFPESGLFFISGEVEDGTISSSNGAGKSAVFEALCWGLYGQTIRNVGKGDVVNRLVGRDCVVDVQFEDDQGELCRVVRYRNHTKYQNSLLFYKGDEELTLSEVKDTQDVINSVLGMNWLVFSTAVVFGEKAQRFAEARDSEKKQVFDEILMLQKYQDAQKQVREDLRRLNEEFSSAQTKRQVAEEGVRAVSGVLDQWSAELENLKNKKLEMDEYLNRLRDEIRQLASEQERKKEESKHERTKYEELSQKGKAIFSELQTVEREKQSALKDITSRLVEERTLLATTAAAIRDLQLKKRNVLKMEVGATCPTCGQSITPVSLEQVSLHFDTEITTLQAQEKLLDSEVRALTEKESTISNSYAQKVAHLIQQKTVVEGELDTLVRKCTSLDLEVQELMNRISSREMEIANSEKMLEEKSDTIRRSIERELEKIRTYENTIREVDTQLGSIAQEMECLKFWESGFGNQGIKSFLLDEIVPQLNARVGFYANALMDEEIIIEFDTESTLKSGDVRDKFDVRIIKSGEKIDYSSCSSGEKRRIDVAILLALQSLVYERGASNSNLIILDEVFDSLDRTGIERVSSLLMEEATDKLVYVISHVSEFRDYFSRELFVSKKNGFSTLIEQSEGGM
jgi:DNA repair exonuclease SbcCD ATPase subunit